MIENNNLAKSDDVVDLKELVLFIWKGKVTICVVAAAFLCMAMAYILIVPASVDISLEVRPISRMDFNEYTELNRQTSASLSTDSELNSKLFFAVSRSNLVELLMEELVQREEIISAVETTGLVDRKNYQSEADYRADVLKAAFKFVFEPPTNIEKLAVQNRKVSAVNDYWTIRYEGPFEEKALESIEKSLSAANEVVRKKLGVQFDNQVMLNRRENEHRLADIKRSRANLIADYETQTADRLSYLKEQAEIARALGVSEDTIEAESYSVGSSVLTNVQTERPFYMRGYKAIEKEIDVLESRENKEAFITNLRGLDVKKRAILQGVAIERAQSAFDASPIASKTEFKAVEYNIFAAEVETQRKTALIVLLATVLGLIAGVVVYYIAYVIKSVNSAS